MFSRTRFTASFFPLLGVIALVIGLVGTSPLYAQVRSEPLREGELFTGQQMRSVFRDVVSEANKWTVRILSDGKQVAFGTIVDSQGWILTKLSQLRANVAKVTVEFSDGQQFPAQLLNQNQKLDLALLKIDGDARKLEAVSWSSEPPLIGAWMVTPGLPPDSVISIGVLSVPRRQIPRSSSHGYLGVGLGQDGTPKIRQVFANSAASQAGLKEGDIVVQVDDLTISSAEQLVKALKGYRPGDTLTLKIRRQDEEIPYAVTLMPQYGEMLSRVGFQNQMGGELSYRRDDFEAVLQHDSVLSPIECGGPVVDLDGRAIGINIARAGRTETYALPADLLIPAIESMKAAAESTFKVGTEVSDSP